MTGSRRSRAGRRPACPRDTQLGINVIVGLAVVVIAAFASSVVPASASGVRLVLVALVLVGFTAIAGDVAVAPSRPPVADESGWANAVCLY